MLRRIVLVGGTGGGDLHHGNYEQKTQTELGVASHLVNADSFVMSREDERRLRKATMMITATRTMATITTTTTLTAMMVMVGESWASLLTGVVAGA